eukprot:Clim_evm26s143 gene=Clim_evmTU26s143
MSSSKIANLLKSHPDWAAIGKKVAPAAYAEFNGLRKRYDTVREKLIQTSETPAAIDWDFYKKQTANPEMIDEFKEVYEAADFSKAGNSADLEKAAKDLAAKREASMKGAAEVAQRARDAVAKLQADLAVIEGQKKISELTTTDILKENPQYKAEWESKMAKGEW